MHISAQAPLGRSLWSGYHWKDLFLLQKLSMNDANFGQRWWRQKWKKGQGSSRPVTAGTGVNGLNYSKNFVNFSLDIHIKYILIEKESVHTCHAVLRTSFQRKNNFRTNLQIFVTEIMLSAMVWHLILYMWSKLVDIECLDMLRQLTYTYDATLNDTNHDFHV